MKDVTNNTRSRRRWASPSLAVAFVALLAALAGTAVALPGKNTVKSDDIKNGQVKKADIKNSAVTSGKVKDGSLLGKDFKAGELPKGDKGDKGAGGAQGPQGPIGPSAVKYQHLSAFSVAECGDITLAICTNQLGVTVGPGSFLIQFTGNLDNAGALPTSVNNRCGLVRGPTVLNRVRGGLAGNGLVGETASIAMSQVVESPVEVTIWLRCTEMAGENILVEYPRLTALKVGSVTTDP